MVWFTHLIPSNGLVVPPASHLTLSLSSHPSFQSALHCLLSELCLFVLSFHLLCLSLHPHYSLYVQGAFTAWDRGQAPLQEELRDSHHEWRESCQSGLHIAAGDGLPKRGVVSSWLRGRGPRKKKKNSPPRPSRYASSVINKRGRCNDEELLLYTQDIKNKTELLPVKIF